MTYLRHFFSKCLILGLLSGFAPQLQAQTGCPDCDVVLPIDIPADTLYFSTLPEGTVGVEYNQTASFRVPLTTTPINAVDPTVPAGITIVGYTLSSLTNIPPGLDFTVSNTEIDPTVNPDGCIRFCGTPTVAGTYLVEANIIVSLGLFSQNYTLELELVVLPDPNAPLSPFGVSGLSGCNSLTSSFTNNFPSNGNSGYSYAWNFGNTQISTEENPLPVTYTAPGVYTISYTLTIDTVGPLLNSFQLSTAACGDNNLPPFSIPEPDLYLNVLDGAGIVIYTSIEQQNANLPYNFFLPALSLLPGENYTIEVFDADLPPFDNDDLCGVFAFTSASNGLPLTSSDATAQVGVLTPTTIINGIDSVTVFAIPAAPVISNSSGEAIICGYDDLIFMTGNTGAPQFFLNGNTFTPIDSEINQTGTYTGQYTDANGCTSTLSNALALIFSPPPVSPTWNNNGTNFLQLDNNLPLPTNYSLQWLLDNQNIAGETGDTLCVSASGTYTLQITNTDNGCTNSFSNFVPYNPTFNCYTQSADPLLAGLKIFPNPARELLHIEMETWLPLRATLVSVMGQTLLDTVLSSSQSLYVAHFPRGMYVLHLSTSSGTRSVPVLLGE